jgi:hypothetical protein
VGEEEGQQRRPVAARRFGREPQSSRQAVAQVRELHQEPRLELEPFVPWAQVPQRGQREPAFCYIRRGATTQSIQWKACPRQSTPSDFVPC